MRSLVARIYDTLRRRALDVELDDEMATHLELAAAALQARGMTREEAWRTARKDFGGLSQTKEADRDLRSFPEVERAWAILREAVGLVWKQPRFFAVAVLTLALGIGATTAVFSVVRGVLLKPLPFRDPERLVALYHVTPARQQDFQGASTYFTYRAHGRVFEDIGLWSSGNVAAIRRGTPEQLRAVRVTDGTLPLLGVRPELGRLPGRQDDTPGAPLVAVLTHTYWQQAFGGSPDAIGQSIVINGAPCAVIGILPAAFRMLDADPQVILPLRLDRATTRALPFQYNGLARLKPDVTIADANADIARMIPLIVTEFPLPPGVSQATWDAIGLAGNVRPLSDAVIGDAARPLWMLLGTVGVVLLMAWGNVANLLVVRAEVRQQELAVRSALGASRGRIAAALLAESAVLGLAGVALGVLLAHAGVGLLRRMAPAALPRLDDISIDVVVLLVTLGTAVVTSLLFGLVPVVRSRAFTVALLKQSSRLSTAAPARHRMRNAVVVAQVALALLLLLVSSLMARTFVAMRQVDPGFARPAEVETFELSLPRTLIPDGRQVVSTFEQMSGQLARIPGVTAVGLGTITMDGRAGKGPIFIEGTIAPALPPIRSSWTIGVGYFEAMETPILAGRTLTWTDLHQLRPVALISENLAREYWDSPATAIGHRIRTFADAPWQEIVGVVGNVRADGLNHAPPTLVYLPVADAQAVTRNVMYVVRSQRAGTAGFLRELQQAVWSVNKDVPLANVRTLANIEARSMAQTSFATTMLGMAAGVALLLALVGIYSVVSYIAAERTEEVGVRMALGAQAGDVRRLFLRHGFRLTITGIVLGLGAALMLTPVMSALLYGVDPLDPFTYAGVSIVIGGVTMLAMFFPAHRASRAAPILALRSGR
ncbi:MAG TPA: ABC transporter permease [Vicinamibacterales bacterium]|nr:ABC transporter permease [Vicinamibacterales bacterium]